MNTLLFNFVWNNGRPLIATTSSLVSTNPCNKFYHDLLESWFDFIIVKPAIFNELLAEPLFYNDLFKIGGRHISTEYLDWAQAGITTVAHILQCNGSFCNKSEVETQFNIVIRYLKYHKIVIYKANSFHHKNSIKDFYY